MVASFSCCGELYGHATFCPERPKPEPKPVPKQRAAPRISAKPTACIYCGVDTRRGSLNLDGQYAHKSCYKRENNDV